MVQASLNPNITFLGEKLWPVAWNQKFTSVIQGKKRKNANKKRKKMKISKKSAFFSCQLIPKIRFLA